jgi:hypothetical protein
MSTHQFETIPVLTDALPVAESRDEAAEARAEDATNTGDALIAEQALEAAVPPDVESLIAELQTRLASSTFALTEELLREAFNEMEAKLYEQISARLRRELPELIDTLLREHLAGLREHLAGDRNS